MPTGRLACSSILRARRQAGDTRRHMRQPAAFSSHRDVEVIVDVAHSDAQGWREICTVFKPSQSQALLARFRTWIDTHTDQVIISGSLILGFWLLAHRQQPVPAPHLRHAQISMELS